MQSRRCWDKYSYLLGQANNIKNFIIRLKYRSCSCCCCCSCCCVAVVLFFLVVVYSKIHMNFKDKLEIQTETRKGFIFYAFFLYDVLVLLFLPFFFLQELIVRVLGVALIVQLCVYVCVCSIYVYVFAFVLCIYWLQKQESKTRHNVSASVLPVLMAFGLFMLPRIRHTHTHTRNTHTDWHIE